MSFNNFFEGGGGGGETHPAGLMQVEDQTIHFMLKRITIFNHTVHASTSI